MKWHVVCLVSILLQAINPITSADLPTTSRDHSNASPAILAPASYPGDRALFSWLCWSTVVWAYAACPGSVTLCRRRSVPRWISASSGRKGQAKRSKPAAAPVIEPDPPGEAPSTAEGSRRIPLQLVLHPGVLLTQRGVQLRPMIARLGQDVAEYRTLER